MPLAGTPVFIGVMAERVPALRIRIFLIPCIFFNISFSTSGLERAIWASKTVPELVLLVAF